MILKVAALVAVAITSHVRATPTAVEWIFNDGPNKGYLCGRMIQNGSQYGVFFWNFPTNVEANSPALVPVPYQYFPTLDEAVEKVQSVCPIK